MPTKLTLSMQKQVIEKAKYYAKSTDQSLSKLVESYLVNISNSKEEIREESLQSLYGVIRLPDRFDESVELRLIMDERMP